MKEIKIGLLTITAGLVFYFGFNFLKGKDLFGRTSIYYVVYSNVDGLDKSNPVIVNGLAVGKVSDIQLRQDFNNQVVVQLSINSAIILGDSTIAELSNTNFLGSKAIILNIGSIENPLEPKDTLIAHLDRGIAEYLDNVQPITDNLNVTIRRVNEILLGLQGSGETVASAIAQLEQTLKQVNGILDDNRQGMSSVIANTNGMLVKMEKRIDQLSPIFNKAEGVLDSLNGLDINKTLLGLNETVSELKMTISGINEGQGTLGQLMVNDSLYHNINQLMYDLDNLIIHFNNYPKDFLKPLGRKNSKMKGIKQSQN
ncbi:MAG: MCE family protein [Flammeovirgaceae bacterium]|jgi:phospholipid/cholesterol/gamma-HCH transport system substrate-binding protein|nr:MCE family protein [Flammeovirgaceae bacterium]|tara:strand:- start:17572 stop:18510 length:939 start_codon:yes stop_codon:yes gene_type:complete